MPQIDLGQVVGPQGAQGEPGPQGAQGIQGPAGPAATINGVNALTIEAGDNIELSQIDSTTTLSVPTDAAPTKDSTKPVQSGGVAAALSNKANRNLLDNWYFMNPVNQRGVSGTISEAGYFIDRWKLVSGSVTLTSTGITINGTISQVLENAAGTNVTASALTTTGIVSVSYDNSSKTFTITGTGQTFVAAKLELGSQQTLAHQDEDGNWVLNEIPDYGEELAKCQRYFWKSLSPNGYSILGYSIATSQAGAYLLIALPVSLRDGITPSLSTINFSNLIFIGTNGPETLSHSWMIDGASAGDKVLIQCQGTFITGQTYLVVLNNSDTLSVSAEL